MGFGIQGEGQIEYTRPDGSVVRPTVIERGSFGRKQSTERHLEPVVDLAGNVIAAEVCTWLDKPGIRLVVEHEGRVMLTRHALDLGVVLYRDMCMGNIEGIEASPVHWKIYEAVSELKAKNQVPADGALPANKLYHPEVVRRRKQDSGGVRRLSAEEVDFIVDGIRSLAEGDEDEARKAAKKRNMVVPEDGKKRKRKLAELIASVPDGD